MSTFLFMVLFIMNILSLTAVFFLFRQVQMLKNEKLSNFSEITTTFLEDIRKENEQLQKSILNHPAQQEHISNNPTIPQHTVKQQLNTADTLHQPPIINDLELNSMNDQFETSLQANVLHLHNQGISTEDIAQQLNCGKTEAALIIKLHKKTN